MPPKRRRTSARGIDAPEESHVAKRPKPQPPAAATLAQPSRACNGAANGSTAPSRSRTPVSSACSRDDSLGRRSSSTIGGSSSSAYRLLRGWSRSREPRKIVTDKPIGSSSHRFNDTMNGGVERCAIEETRTIREESTLAELRSLRASASRLRLSLFTAIALGTLVALALASVVYVDNTVRLYDGLRQDSLQNETIQSTANFTKHLRGVMSKLHGAEATIHRQQVKTQQYTTAIHHRRTMFKLAIDRMKKEDASEPVVELACHRIETALKTHETDQDSDIAQSMRIDEELTNALEMLSNRLHQKSLEKESIEQAYKNLLVHAKGVESMLGLLQFNHWQMAELYHPLLSYVETLHARLDHRASAMLGLTTLVHSLNEALESSHAELEEQRQDSSTALDEVALAAKDFSLANAEAYEMERRNYMEYMQMRLDRQEDEAVGAVHAVATAAGKLEYERKMEEVARWASYTAETEDILASVKRNVHEAALEDIANERSVLKAAISRRIEEGMASLKSYIHPYSYLRDRSPYGKRMKIGSPQAEDE